MKTHLIIVSTLFLLTIFYTSNVKAQSKLRAVTYEEYVAPLQHAQNAHNQAESQIYDYLTNVNSYIKQGDYDNAELLIDRCIQLNARWQYHLIDHSILTNKKQEISNAKYGTNNQSNNYNHYSNQTNNSSDAIAKFRLYVNDAYRKYNEQDFSLSREYLEMAYNIVISNLNAPWTKYDKKNYNRMHKYLIKMGY